MSMKRKINYYFVLKTIIMSCTSHKSVEFLVYNVVFDDTFDA